MLSTSPCSNPLAPLHTGEAAATLGADTPLLHVARRLPPALAMAFEEAAMRDLDHRVMLSRAGGVDALLAPLEGHAARDFLARDVAMLLRMFLDLADADRAHACLVATGADECRKFHVDQISARLLCTYHGPGTQWIHPEDVREEARHEHHADVEAFNAALLREGAAPQRARTGDILFFKGARWSGRAHGLLHRSPPIAHANQRRLLVKLSTTDSAVTSSA